MSLILRTATRVLVPLILVFSIFIMLRGHNAPGGGFIGGMVAGGAFALYLLSHDLATARSAVPIPPALMVAIGLLTATASGIIGLAMTGSYLTGIWADWTVPVLGTVTVGTPILFDIGVYLLVTGMTLSILFHLAEET
jgi:multicomponent Na+:H+ antiporter subunit B